MYHFILKNTQTDESTEMKSSTIKSILSVLKNLEASTKSNRAELEELERRKNKIKVSKTFYKYDD